MIRNRRLYCDMDGVAADFEAGYERAFGIPCRKVDDNIDWSLVRSVPNFYATLPMMPDFPALWEFIRPYNPTFLTGVPDSINAADNDKHTWLHQNCAPDVPIICCKARDKYKHCQPGDILIDDWTKYQSLWESAGGIWITHTSAANTINQLRALATELGTIVSRKDYFAGRYDA